MAKKELVHVKVNGREREALVEPRLLLVHFIRDVLGLTGTHVGCDTTHCGACTVVLDGKTVKSCTMFAPQADGCELFTVEGLIKDGQLHPLQEGFQEEHGLQCGFCTPGMLMSSYVLLQKNGKAKPPGVAETLDCTRSAIALGKDRLDVETVEQTLGCLAKSMEDGATVKAAGIEKMISQPY